MTDDLLKRVWQHKEGLIPGFTRDHGIKTLVWYEVHDTREGALIRERRIKKWNRAWKLEMIEKMNYGWADLSEGLTP
jgi:putative endonuclease